MTEFRRAVIDLDAIRHNVRHLRALTGTRHLMAVVKANAYGHGAIAVAGAALEGGADWLGVADLEEAVQLREAGIDAPLLAWLHHPNSDFGWAVRNGVDLGLSSLRQLEAVAVAAEDAATVAQVHLKVETGLSRNGLAPEEWLAAFEFAARVEQAGLINVRGLFSHLANASEAEDRAQLERFTAAHSAAKDAGLSPEIRHLASTAGAISLPEVRLDMVRVGIGVYGLSPWSDDRAEELGLIPAMTVQAGVVAVRRVDRGAGVSYDYTHRAETPTTLGLVPLGYADGLSRAASSRAQVAVNGKRYPVVGRVAMDQAVVDFGDDPVAVGDTAVLFGDPSQGVVSADELAAVMGTINYELVTRIGPRVVREYRGATQTGEESTAAQASTVLDGKRWIIATPEEMHELGLAIAVTLKAGDIVVLDGPLGAGKTTFTRGLGEGLSVRGPITSPTFVVARSHPSLIGGPMLVHVDGYRLSGTAELDDLDIDYARSIVVMEWGADLVHGVADSWLQIGISRPTGAETSHPTGDATSRVSGTDGIIGEGDEAWDEAVEPERSRLPECRAARKNRNRHAP